MSTPIYCLLAIIIQIVNGQTFEDCGSKSITVGNNANQETLTIQLERDLANSDVRITLTGPNDKWFGFVIGQGMMGGGYGVYGSGNANFALSERSLAYAQGGGTLLSSSGTDTVTTGANDNVITLVRSFSVSPGNYFDFSNLLGPQCTTNTMAFGGVIGSSLNYAKHAFETANQVFTSTCSCPTAAPTTDPTASPTPAPTDNPTMVPTTNEPTRNPTTKEPTLNPTTDAPSLNPTTQEPSGNPTTDPTLEPTKAPTDYPTEAGETKDPSTEPTREPTNYPTSDPTADPTQDPTEFISTTPEFTSTEGMTSTIMTTMITDISSTEEMDDEYELCGTAELIDGYTLNVLRNSDEMKVGIMMSGPSDGWFGYGFGTSGMTGSYGVTVEGMDSSSLGIRERTLSKQGAPGTLLDSSGDTTVMINDTTAMAYLFRSYATTNDGYDFSDFMECNADSIDLIAAIGDSTRMGRHTVTQCCEKLERICGCGDDTDMTSTMDPEDDMNSTLADDIDTNMTSTESPEDDGFELCATEELLDGVTLNIYRNTDELSMRIAMTGPSTEWFGYGFGSSVMTGSYGVTVESPDSANPVSTIAERTLDSSAGPGTLLLPSGYIEVMKQNSLASAFLERPYAANNDGFDFSDFLKCNVDSIDLIAAQGNGNTKMSFHALTSAGQTLTRLSTCTCDEEDPEDMTSTMDPVDGDSANNIFISWNIMAIVSICVYLMN